MDEIADCFLACGNVAIKTGKDGCFIKRGDMTMKLAVAGNNRHRHHWRGR